MRFETAMAIKFPSSSISPSSTWKEAPEGDYEPPEAD